MKTSLYRNPFFQVLCAIAAGFLLGCIDADLALRMKPLGDLFIRAIKLLVAPIIFFTVASGIAAAGSIRRLGHVGIKAILCFESLSVLSLLTGLAAAFLLQPGAGFPVGADAGAPPAVSAMPGSLTATLAQVFGRSLILQMLVAGVTAGVALVLADRHGQPVAAFCGWASARLLDVVGVMMKLAPLAAFGAIAYTVGRYGPASMEPLFRLLGALYLTMALFVALVLGALAHLCGFRLLHFLGYIKEELLLVAGVGSSVAAMPKLIEKLERAGCTRAVVGVVIPAGYSFNLNGTGIYLMLALMFLAQATHVELDTAQWLTVFTVALVTSKSASGVAGSAFIALAATLAAVPEIPASSLVFIVGIERLLKCRSLTNMIGNAVACLAISRWAGELDGSKLLAAMRTRPT